MTLPGKGKVTATGKLGDVMKESVQAAESYVKSRSIAFGIAPGGPFFVIDDLRAVEEGRRQLGEAHHENGADGKGDPKRRRSYR